MKCAIDCRVAPTNEIVQLSLVPFEGGIIFDSFIKPKDISLIETGGLGGARFYGIQDVVEKGISNEEVLDLFDRWFNLNKNIKITPIGFNWLDKSYHLIELLGYDLYYMFFNKDYRDLKSISDYIRDKTFIDNPFPKEIKSVTSLCTYLGVKRELSHDSLYLCHLIIECYRKLIKGNY